FEEEPQLKYSVSATTRDMRPGEIHGSDYFFKKHKEFEEMIEKEELLKHAKDVDNYYGTPRGYVEAELEDGNDVFLEIEVQGELQVKENFSGGVFIFLSTPSLDILKNRIVRRCTEPEVLVLNRLIEARKELNIIHIYLRLV